MKKTLSKAMSSLGEGNFSEALQAIREIDDEFAQLDAFWEIEKVLLEKKIPEDSQLFEELLLNATMIGYCGYECQGLLWHWDVISSSTLSSLVYSLANNGYFKVALKALSAIRLPTEKKDALFRFVELVELVAKKCPENSAFS